jgi:hypothetical protein
MDLKLTFRGGIPALLPPIRKSSSGATFVRNEFQKTKVERQMQHLGMRASVPECARNWRSFGAPEPRSNSNRSA